MKTEIFYLAQSHATNLNLISSKDTIAIQKVRDYIKKSPEILNSLLEYLKEIDSVQLKVGDAVLCEDKKKRLVVSLLWEDKAGETKVTKIELIDLDGYKEKFDITKVKKLG